MRQGVALPYPTLHRFAVLELGFGRDAPTMPVADGEPGEELQLDTGWVGWLTLTGHKRRFRAWIFTAVRSRHRFVYPTFEETTARAIEACEAAWEFFGGVFKVLIPDNTKAIITQADPLAPRITPAFLEYAQARGFHIDPARVRHPRDKGRVERAVPDVRDDCFAGEVLTTLDDARTHATALVPRTTTACAGTVARSGRPRALSRPRSSPSPAAAAERRRTRSRCGASRRSRAISTSQVAKALYSVPRQFVGRTLRARADQQTVRLYDGRDAGQNASAAAARRTRRPIPAIFRPSAASTRCAMSTPCAAGRESRRGGRALRRRCCSTARCRGRACGASTRCSASRGATARRA